MHTSFSWLNGGHTELRPRLSLTRFGTSRLYRPRLSLTRYGTRWL